ncbi:MAG: DMT family transporter [Coriobacteriia bacterium]|nr:DMT family transporter [Coriobacteriia bacterium]
MKIKGPLLLLFTALLWGMAFVAQTQAADAVEPFTFNASRNFIGAAFLVGVIFVRIRLGHDAAPSKRAVPVAKGSTCADSADTPGGSSAKASGQLSGYSFRALLVGGFLCGLVLCFSSFLQQAGISSYPDDAAASGRSGFITAIYMILVALFSIFAGKKAHPIVFAAVAVAMLGMYLLCVPNGLDQVYWGDVLVLVCAFGYALHIVVIDRFTYIDGVRLSLVQLLTAGAISLVYALVFEHPDMAQIVAAALPILYAGICSDGIAFTCQIVAQKTTDPTVASILMSLEAVFAALGGWIILGEVLGPVELAGCVLVFAAVLMAQVPDFIENARRKKQV